MGGRGWKEEPSSSTVTVTYPGRIFHADPVLAVDPLKSPAARVGLAGYTPGPDGCMPDLKDPKPHPGRYRPMVDYNPVELEAPEDFAVKLAARGGANATQEPVSVRDSLPPETDKGRDGQ
jgi:hypothetical protein